MKPAYLDNVEEARNRPDKSTLAIRTMCPEKLLTPDVAFPEQVKHLWLNVRLDGGDYCDLEKYLYQKDCNCPKMEGCNLCSWNKKYTNTLCKDLVHFTQLETLEVNDLNLRSDLWIEFAHNSKCLKEIEFTSYCYNDEPYDEFCFDGEFDDSGDHKEKALEAILKIPTLKKASFSNLELPFFPKGPSNIEHLEIYVEPYILGTHQILEKKYDYFNFSSHTNLKSAEITQGILAPLPLHSLQLEKLVNLEKLIFGGYFEGKKDIYSLKDILSNLTKIKDLYIGLDKKGSNILMLEITFNGNEWTIETENKKVTVDSKDKLLKEIEAFELI